MGKKKIVLTLAIVFLVLLAAAGALVLRSKVEEKVKGEYGQAISLYESGKYEDALSLWDGIVRRHPRDERIPSCLYYGGCCREHLGDMEGARRCWRKVVENFPGSDSYPEAIYKLAYLQEKEGELEGALKEYRSIISDFPESKVVPYALAGLGRIYGREGRKDEARKAYEEVLHRYPVTEAASSVRTELGTMNMDLIFSPVPTEDSFVYIAEHGDSLAKIAKKIRTTVALLMRSNHLSDDRIQVNRRLKVIKGEFSIHVDVTGNVLTLKLNDRFGREYRIGTGKYESTPMGKFKVTSKLKNPVWYSHDGVLPPESPQNILGSRWLGIDEPGYGIHGTTQPETIGKHSSAGCIRMYNEDVKELFDLVVEGTPVEIEK